MSLDHNILSAFREARFSGFIDARPETLLRPTYFCKAMLECAENNAREIIKRDEEVILPCVKSHEYTPLPKVMMTSGRVGWNRVKWLE
jgi:hypothetical protein